MGPFQIMLMSFPQTRSFDSRTYINTYQHTSTHISTDQHLSTYINTHQHISQQHISTHINTNQHISTRINMYQHISTHINIYRSKIYQHIYCINTYQHISTIFVETPKVGEPADKNTFLSPATPDVPVLCAATGK